MLSQDVSRYIALNQAMGLKFKAQAYLLRSFAAFAEQRGEDCVHTQTVLDWAALGPSARTRRGRLLTIRRFAEAMRAEDQRRGRGGIDDNHDLMHWRRFQNPVP